MRQAIFNLANDMRRRARRCRPRMAALLHYVAATLETMEGDLLDLSERMTRQRPRIYRFPEEKSKWPHEEERRSA